MNQSAPQLGNVLGSLHTLQPFPAASLPPSTATEVPEAGPSTKSLKRGAACQACRKRKLRCSGDKPTCAICLKTRAECVYDTITTKSKGRLKQLEEKIASLEKSLNQPAPPSATSHQPQEAFSQALGGLFEWNAASTFAPSSTFDATGPNAFDFPTTMARAHTSFDSVAAMQMQQSPSPDEGYDPTAYALQSSVPALFPPQASDSLPSSFDLGGAIPPMSALDSTPPGPAMSPPTPSRVAFGLPDNWEEDLKINSSLRTHLLELFFQRRRQYQISIDVGRFYASLEGPAETQPSLALVLAMCACAAHFSPVADVRGLDSKLVHQSRTAIQADLQDPRANLLQTAQASDLLAALMYTRAAFVEGWVQSGSTARIVAYSCLHKITTSSFSNYCSQVQPWQRSSGPRSSKRRPTKHLAAPRDAMELGERILCFWSAFASDRFAGAMTGRPQAIPDEDILVPFPKTMEEYARDDFGDEPEPTLADLFSVDPVPLSGRPDSSYTTLVKSIAFFHRASHVGESLEVRSSPPSTPDGPPTPIPQVLLDLERSLRNFVDALPPSARTIKAVGGVPPWNVATPIGAPTFGVDPTVFSINTIIYATFMTLYEDMAEFDPSYRSRAVQAATGAVQLISHIVDVDFGQLDLHLPVLWRHFAHLLLEEARRLQDIGELDEASLRQVDVEVLVLSMRRAGEVWGIGTNQATLIETLQTLDLST